MSFVVWMAALFGVQALALLLSPRLARTIPVIFHRLVVKIYGLDIRLIGEVSKARPTLFMANHSSYLDITVLGSIMPLSFVAKSEIAAWPVFGWLAKFQRSVFIERRRSHARNHLDTIGKRLEAKDTIVVFPEGTTGDGNRVLPFKPTLFRLAEIRTGDKPLTVQPVVIAYTHLNNIPLLRQDRPLFTWYGDMTLPSHLFTFLGLGRTRVYVYFLPPLTVDQFADTKAMSRACQAQMAATLAQALSRKPAEVAKNIKALIPAAARA